MIYRVQIRFLNIVDTIPIMVIPLLPILLHCGIGFFHLSVAELLIWLPFLIRCILEPVYLSGWNRLHLPLCLWFIFITISTIFSPARHVSIETLMMISTSLIFYVHLLIMMRQGKSWVYPLVIGVLVFIVADQLSHIIYWLLYHPFSISDRFYSYLENPNLCGAFLILLFPLLLTAQLLKMRLPCAILKSVLILLTVTSIFFTFSRSAWLGLLMELSIYLYFVFRRKNKIPLYFLSMFLLGLIFISAVAFIDSPVTERLRTVTDVRFEDTGSRLMMWKKAIPFGMKRFFVGIGPGGFGPILIKLVPLKTIFLHVHNYYIQSFLEVGLPTTLLFLWWIFNVFKNYTPSPKTEGALIGVAGILFINLFDTSLRIPVIWFYFLVLISWLSNNENIQVRALSRRRGICLLLVLLLPFIVHIYMPSIAVQHYEAGRKHLLFYDYDNALNEFKKAIRFHPTQPVYHSAIAEACLGLYFITGNPEMLKTAWMSYRTAIILYPYDAFYYANLAWTEYLVLKYPSLYKENIPNPEISWNKAMSFDPQNLFGFSEPQNNDLVPEVIPLESVQNKTIQTLLLDYKMSSSRTDLRMLLRAIGPSGSPHTTFDLLFYNRFPPPGETFFGKHRVSRIYLVPRDLMERIDEQ